jgi:pimeloyl-ACP methyl ester carboxylesterase
VPWRRASCEYRADQGRSGDICRPRPRYQSRWLGLARSLHHPALAAIGHGSARRGHRLPGVRKLRTLTENPTFDRLAEVTAEVIDALDIGDYAMYMFDFGAPVGFRIALRHDVRVRGIVTQNGNAYIEGFGTGFALSK